MTARTEFLGAWFDAADTDAVATWLAARGEDTRFAYVVTPNVDHIVRLVDDAEMRATYAEADLCVCDSRVLQRLARLFGIRLALAPGSDLVAVLLNRVAQPGDRIVLVGGTAAGFAALGQRYPRFTWVHHAAPMGLARDPAARAAVAAEIADIRARFTLLAVGTPQQELIAHLVAGIGTATGTALCIGAGADFLIGAQRRAPRVVQRAGMEWAWRLAGNPRRLARRYLVDGPRIFALVWAWRRRNR